MTNKWKLNKLFSKKNNVINDKETGNVYTISTEKNPEPTDFETAINEVGYGKFHILLLLIAVPTAWSAQFESTSMSYVLPAAQCDLNLSMENSGLIKAIPYAGMLCSSFIWGFLSDTFGRRKLLVFGYLTNGVLELMTTIAYNFEYLIILKFLGGAITPHSVFICYLAEFQPAKYRSRTQIGLGILYGCGNIFLPLLAMAVMNLLIYYPIAGGGIVFRSWNLYLLITTLPSFISGICYIFLPESPKYLMTMGKNTKALEIFQKIYKMNTGKSTDTYPVKQLKNEVGYDENKTKRKSNIEKLKEGCGYILPIFLPPYTKDFILLLLLISTYMMSINTLRLWLPQLFQSISDYQITHQNQSASICEMLEIMKPNTASETSGLIEECVFNFNPSVYYNSMIIAAVQICGYLMISYLINYIPKKLLLMTLGVTSGICACCIYVAQNETAVLVLSSANLLTANICVDVIVSIVVDVFPTNLRTKALSLVMSGGRSGAILGNVVFPILLQIGCAPPFFVLGCSSIICALIGAIFLPKTDMTALK